MLDKNYKEAIKILYSKLKSSNLEWYLTGKISLILQGVKINPKNIGVLIHEKDLKEFLKLFEEYEKSEIVELSNKEAKEFTIKINNIQVLVCAEYPHGIYWKVKEINKVKIDNLEIPCFSLKSNKDAYEKIGMPEKAKLIEEFLEEKLRNS